MGLEAAGTVPFAGRTVPRLGFGAMRLPGPGVSGPPRDRAAAVSLVRRAVDQGVRVIDTAWYYGPDVADEILAEALRPYRADLVFVTKLGAERTGDKAWTTALRPEQLRAGCERELRLLGVDSVPVTHLRWTDDPASEASFVDALGAMRQLRQDGKIEYIGLSNVTLDQLDIALQVTDIASVSNSYSVTGRDDDPMVERCERLGIAYLPFFPFDMGRVRRHDELSRVAESLHATPVQVAIAWLLRRSPVILPIPGTSRIEHLEENLAAADLALPENALA